MRRILTVLATAFFTLAVYAQAQKSQAQRPDAPLPNAPAATAELASRPAFRAAGSAGSATMVSAMQDASTYSGTISLYTVVDLALRNSKAVRISEAAVQRARGALSETRDIYIPNFSLGSGLGYSYGFPLGTPTIFSVNSTSLLLSFSQHDYVRSANAALKSAALSLKNVRRQIILDASVDYIDLNTTLQEIGALNEAVHESDALISVLQDRLRAGFASEMDVTRAQLTQAQVQVRIFQLQDHAEELRVHLSNLTGMNEALIAPQISSIPPLPDLDFASVMNTSGRAPSVLAADAKADAKMFAAWGDQRQNYRPTVQFAAQYALFSTFNNYQNYYNKASFQQNNFGIGIQAAWPLFDPARHNKAIESRAEAEQARRQAELARMQNSETDMKLWHNLQELEAQAKVAQLQQQIAQETLATTITQMNQGSASPGAPAVTPQQTGESRIQERTSFVDLQDAQFSVTRIKLNLLSAVGGLEDWVRQEAQSSSPLRQVK